MTDQPGPKRPEQTMPLQDKSASLPLEDLEWSETVSASNRFALDMYRELAKEKGNIFFSPWSLSYALAMTCEGARGKTKEEMSSVLHFSAIESTRRRSFSLIDTRLNASDSGDALHSANALWVEKSFPLDDEYADLIEQSYHARSTNLDFINASEKSRRIINSWVEEKTLGKIKELIPPNVIDELTRLIITNAIYFKGSWRLEFDRKLTAKEDFFTGQGRTVAVPMMRRLDDNASFGYFEYEGMQVLKMPYLGDRLSLTIILPRNNDLAPLEATLDAETLSRWRMGLVERRVDVYIPKFKVASNYLLNESLIKLGMPTAFDDSAADFTGLSIKWGRLLYISRVFHQAHIEVNEEGTEATAATAVVIKYRCLPPKPPVFRADRPFIFMITDDETGLILFLGRVNDPGAD